jgi:hypothetical protein
MDETNAALDRLEARIDQQAARIDTLCEMLEQRGVLPRSTGPEARDLSSVWKRKSPPARPRSTRIRVGEATGV